MTRRFFTGLLLAARGALSRIGISKAVSPRYRTNAIPGLRVYEFYDAGAAADFVRKFQEQTQGKRLPPREYAHQVYIYSLWPHALDIGAGGMGTYRISACVGAVSAPLLIQGEESAHYDVPASLLATAREIIRGDNLYQFGVFIAASEIPTDDEISAARQHMMKMKGVN